MVPLPLALVAAYLLGAIPFSFVVARLWGVRDVREVGSGNVGATNVMRSAGKVPGAIAFVLDAAKGAVAAWLATRLGGPEWLPPACAAAAVAGHMYPVFLGFRGGKGVATGAGAFLPLAPWATLIAFVTFAVVAAATRYVSVGSVVGAVALALGAWATGAPPPTWVAATLVSAVVIWKHRENLARLATGRENKLGAVKS
ncbi:MAG: glycerol-3-phosphate 1-O-acyltransferase PlsY [Vicinamibacteria bacterium]|jgi:glycerol-3-phosphate acyltransferase PlsY|nr:glycerol-3-phosphate 1-O-acyltransferase PlsY [Vicinamibacteria bacterium]